MITKILEIGIPSIILCTILIVLVRLFLPIDTDLNSEDNSFISPPNTHLKPMTYVKTDIVYWWETEATWKKKILIKVRIAYWEADRSVREFLRKKGWNWC